MIQATNRKYLRYIYQLLLEGKKVRQIDLALSLGYARSSASIAIKQLKKAGYIDLIKNNITLTERGSMLAQESLKSYQQVYRWILALGLTSYEARLYADKLESDFDQKFIEMLLKDKRLNN